MSCFASNAPSSRGPTRVSMPAEKPHHLPFLLHAPLNASYAADNAAYFSQKGFSGFSFEGLVPDPASGTQESPPALVDELKGAVGRLSLAGLNDNYFSLSIPPDRRIFSTPAAKAAFVAQAGATGRFCSAAGLRGLALETRQDGSLFDYSWEGYDLFETSPELRAGARELAVDGLRAFLRGAPDARLLLFAEDPLRAGSLWWSFFAGALEAPGAAEDVSLFYLLPRATVTLTQFEPLRVYLSALQGAILEHLSPALRMVWQRQGQLVPVLAPLTCGRGSCTAWLMRRASGCNWRRQKASPLPWSASMPQRAGGGKCIRTWCSNMRDLCSRPGPRRGDAGLPGHPRRVDGAHAAGRLPARRQHNLSGQARQCLLQ